METRPGGAAPAAGAVVVAGASETVRPLVAAVPSAVVTDPAGLGSTLAGVGPVRLAVLASPDLRELAGLVRVAARPLVKRRSGALVCVLPLAAHLARLPAADLARTAAAEAAAAFFRSAAADLDYYGVPVTGVLAVDPAPAALLTEGTGGVWLASGGEPARVVPIEVERELVTSDRRLRTADVAAALGGPATLAGRVAVVTGGGGGIGAAVAAGLAADGAAVVVADLGCNADGAGRDPGPAAAVAAGITARGGRAVAACVDVASPDGCAALARRAVAAFGRLDAVVHAAGVVRPALVFEATDEDWDAVHRVHVAGASALVGECLPELRRHGSGRVVLLSSRSVTGSPGQTAYAAAKGAVLGLAHQLAADLAGAGITVATVLPSGRTRASAPERLDSRRRRIELLRARHHGITDPAAYRDSPEQDPATNAAMVSWLCSPAGAAGHGRIFGTGGWRVERYRPSTLAAIRSSSSSWKDPSAPAR